MAILLADWTVGQIIWTVVVVGILFAVGGNLYRSYRRHTSGHLWQWWRTMRGQGMGVAELARRLDLPADDLRLLETAYREAFIPKRRRGRRRLHIPNPQLKKVQRRILRRLLRKLRTHPAAMGFEKGKSIVHNAATHVGKKVVIKLDLIDFFPTTRTERVDAYFRRIGWNAEAAALLTRLCTHAGGLPQGASTSPRLSNLVNFFFDHRLDCYVRRHHGTYTRYADDITISLVKDSSREIRGIIQFARRLARAFGYEVHRENKLRVLRPHQQQRVTGLVVNSKVQLPRAKRRWLRAVAHRLRTERPATLSAKQLEGWAALANMIQNQTTRE